MWQANGSRQAGFTLFSVMPAQTGKAVEPVETYWSLQLLSLMQEMAAESSNAVLMLLADIGQLETERRYPDAGLLFGGGHWRAYYHCHEAVSMHASEHGHFHLFTDIGDRAWAHVAGLSIDAEGQPLQWFAVNRWVTDGPWLPCQSFFEQLRFITANEAVNPVGSWLGGVLQICRGDLFDLLSARDQRLEQFSKKGALAEALENREIYLLASSAIELQSTLEKHLLCIPADVLASARINNNEHKSD